MLARLLLYTWSLLLTFHRDERGGWQDIFSTIPDWLGKIVGKLWESADHLWHGFQDRIGDFMQLIWDAADAIWKHAVYAILGLANIVSDALGNIFHGLLTGLTTVSNFIADSAGSLRDHVIYALGGIGNFIADAAGSVWSHITYAIGGVVTTIADAAGSVWSHITYALGGIGNFISDGLGSLADKLWDRLGDLLEGVRGVADKVDDLPEAALNTALDHKEEVLAAFLGGPAGLAVLKGVQELWEHRDDIVDAAVFAGKKADAFAVDSFETILDTFVGFGRTEPEQATERLMHALFIATGFGIVARLPALAKDHAPLVSNTAFTEFGAFLSQFSDWGKIVDAGLGTAINLSIQTPMEHHLNKRALSSLPRLQDTVDLYRRGFIGDGTLKEVLARLGYGPDWADNIGDNAYLPFRRREVEMLTDVLDLPDNVLEGLLVRAGYSPENRDLLTKAFQTKSLSRSAGKWFTAALSAYGDGFIDAAALTDVMAVLGFSEREMAYYLMAAQADYANAVKSEMQSAFRSAAARDAMTDDELRAGLAQLGLTSDKIDVEVARANVARLKKPVDDVDAAQRAAVNKARELMTQAYRLQYRKGAIDEQTFLAALTFIGIPEVQARAVVALTNAESLQLPPAVPVDTPEMARRRTLKDLQDAYVLQYQHDLIDAQTLQGALEGTGMAPYEANAIVLREQARHTPSPEMSRRRTQELVESQVRTTASAAYVEQYRQGFISADHLEAALVQLGIEPQVAHNRRLLEEARVLGQAAEQREAVMDRAQEQLLKADQAAAVEAFRKGVITADALQAALVSIGLSRELAASIRQYEELHALRPPPAATAGP